MLTSLVLTLTTHSPLTFPPHLGRASHAALLRLIAQADPDLAEQLHAPDERRPFTCSNLWGVRRKGRSLTLAPDALAFLRYTGLTAEVSGHLQRLAEDPPSHIELEGARLAIQQATLDLEVHPWAGHTTYEELSVCTAIVPRLGKSSVKRMSNPCYHFRSAAPSGMMPG